MERSYPAGQWFSPPPGRYRAWIEGDGRISPHSVILQYSASPFRGAGLIGAMTVVPAGTVALAASEPVADHTLLRLLHTESHNRGAYPQRELSRLVEGEALDRGALMPAGPIIAGLYDRRKQEYLGVTRPISVVAGERLELSPRPPASGTDLVVVLEWPTVLDRFDRHDLQLTAVVQGGVGQGGLAQGEPVPPELLVSTAERVYAVWYGLHGSYAEVQVHSATLHLAPLGVPLRPRKVERVTATLRPRPNLSVEIELPALLSTDRLSLRARVLPERTVAAQADLSPTVTFHRFDHLPAAPVEVVLETDVGDFRERVDLSDGRDGTVRFHPEPIFLRGTVYRGREPHPAKLVFKVGGEQGDLQVETDGDGGYEAVLFRPVTVLAIELAGNAEPPFLELLRQPIRQSQVRDFHLPGNAYQVRVVDALTGEGVPRAEIDVYNTARDGTTTSQAAVADEAGLATLQPLRPGEVALSASGEGYLRSREPLRVTVGGEDQDQLLQVTLEPEGTRRALRLLLPGGAPAAGAEVRAQAALSGGLVWQGRSDERGLLEVPDRAQEAWLLVRHPAAGFLVRRWETSHGYGETPAWSLPSRAAAPLSLRLVDAWGHPASWAQLALWVDGRRLEGPALSWLLDSRAAADRDGYWQGQNLPALPVQVLAWAISARERAHTGSLDLLAVDVPHPWAGVVEVSVVE